MAMVHPIFNEAGRDQDYIINLAQSPIPFTFKRQRTLEFVGAPMVSICKLACDTKQATLAVTITASIRTITPVLVFKGMLGGDITTQDLATYPCSCMYAWQSLAWMD